MIFRRQKKKRKIKYIIALKTEQNKQMRELILNVRVDAKQKIN